jgi:hypothetical protein
MHPCFEGGRDWYGYIPPTIRSEKGPSHKKLVVHSDVSEIPAQRNSQGLVSVEICASVDLEGVGPESAWRLYIGILQAPWNRKLVLISD